MPIVNDQTSFLSSDLMRPAREQTYDMRLDAERVELLLVVLSGFGCIIRDEDYALL